MFFKISSDVFLNSNQVYEIETDYDEIEATYNWIKLTLLDDSVIQISDEDLIYGIMNQIE